MKKTILTAKICCSMVVVLGFLAWVAFSKPMPAKAVPMSECAKYSRHPVVFTSANNRSVTAGGTIDFDITMHNRNTGSTTFPNTSPNNCKEDFIYNVAVSTNTFFDGYCDDIYPYPWLTGPSYPGGKLNLFPILGNTVPNVVLGSSLDSNRVWQDGTARGRVSVRVGDNTYGKYPPAGTYYLKFCAEAWDPAGPTYRIGEGYQAFTVTALPKYTITASAGANGSISPSGAASVDAYTNKTYTITPSAGYNVADVKVDNVSQGALSTYTFSNISANHTINATFVAVPTYALTVQISPSDKGKIKDQPQVNFDCGDGATDCVHNFPANTNIRLVATPITGWNVSGWSTSGGSSSCTVSGAGSQYCDLKTASQPLTVTVTLSAAAVPQYVIVATTGLGGTIAPNGSVSVAQGGNQSFTINANSGYQIADVKVDGASVGAVGNYDFTNVTANHTIEASFSPVAMPTSSGRTATVIVSWTDKGQSKTLNFKTILTSLNNP